MWLALWLLRVFGIGPTCYECQQRIVPCEFAVPVPCPNKHTHYFHETCLFVREVQRMLSAEKETKREARA